jgi:hypothetical protein
MEKLGELDTLPALAVCAQVEKPLSMKYKAKATAAQTIAASLPYRPEYLPSVTLEAMKQMEEKGVKGDPLRRYQFWLGQVQSVALETQPNSAERAQRVEALADATKNPALSREVADTYLAAFERWRPKLFR